MSAKRNLLKASLTLIFASVVIGASPILSVILASGVATSAGCVLNEARPHPCLIGPFDAGSLLYALGVSGWFMLVTVPAGLAGVGVGLVFLVVALVQRGRRVTR